MANSGRVCIVDDDGEMHRSIAWGLEPLGYVVRTFSTADDFLAQKPVDEPTAVLIDLLLPGMTGLGLCREIVARSLPYTFAIISGHADVPSAVEAMKLGAVDLLEKPFSVQRLLEIVNSAVASARDQTRLRVEQENVARQLESLSPREREIFHAVGAGLVTKEIAARLGISSRTVDVHRSNMMQKLGLESPVQLASLLAAVQRTGTARWCSAC